MNKFAERNKTPTINFDFFDGPRKQLGKFSLNFSRCNSFPSKPFAAKDGCKLFQCSDIAIVNKNGSYFQVSYDTNT